MPTDRERVVQKASYIREQTVALQRVLSEQGPTKLAEDPWLLRGVRSETDLARYSAMIGFRNRLVHGYQEISLDQLTRILSEELDDLNRFADIMLGLV